MSADLSEALSARARALAPSPTMAIDARAKELVASGVDLVNLSAGEPDFDTPREAADAAVEAIRAGFTHYTATEGIRELREAVAEKLQRDNGLRYTPEEIVVTVGAKQASYNALQVLCNPGDEVLIPAPYWVSYTEQAKLAGAVPVAVPTSEQDRFQLRADAVAERITPRSRVLLVNTPCNPTGAVFPRRDLEALGELALRHRLIVISDEIYEKLVYDGAEHVSLAGLDPELRRRTLVLNGLSKAYAMTGWRIGYAAGDRALIRPMASLQSQSTSNITSIAQKAAVAALRGSQEPVARMAATFARRRSYVLERLAAMQLVSCARPDGAFYVFPNVSAAFGRRTAAGVSLTSGDTLCAQLLEEARLAVVPGSAFGSPENVRVSYAASEDALASGMDRLEGFLRALGG